MFTKVWDTNIDSKMPKQKWKVPYTGDWQLREYEASEMMVKTKENLVCDLSYRPNFGLNFLLFDLFRGKGK